MTSHIWEILKSQPALSFGNGCFAILHRPGNWHSGQNPNHLGAHLGNFDAERLLPWRPFGASDLAGPACCKLGATTSQPRKHTWGASQSLQPHLTRLPRQAQESAGRQRHVEWKLGFRLQATLVSSCLCCFDKIGAASNVARCRAERGHSEKGREARMVQESSLTLIMGGW